MEEDAYVDIDMEGIDENLEKAYEAIQWNKFKEFCEKEGIDTENSEDYETWWKCFKLAWDLGTKEGQF